MTQEEWVVYIILTESNKLYTGITTDLQRRFAEHKEEGRGAKFFRTSRPDKIVFQERHKNRSLASMREAEIKKMSRSQKLILIQHQAEQPIADQSQSSKSN